MRNCKPFGSEDPILNIRLDSIVRYVLLQDGSTPLMHAANNEFLDICKLLLEKGANVNLKDEVGCNCHVIRKRLLSAAS